MLDIHHDSIFPGSSILGTETEIVLNFLFNATRDFVEGATQGNLVYRIREWKVCSGIVKLKYSRADNSQSFSNISVPLIITIVASFRWTTDSSTLWVKARSHFFLLSFFSYFSKSTMYCTDK